MLGAGDLSRQLTNDAAIFSGDQSAIASMTRTQCSVQTIDERACNTPRRFQKLRAAWMASRAAESPMRCLFSNGPTNVFRKLHRPWRPPPHLGHRAGGAGSPAPFAPRINDSTALLAKQYQSFRDADLWGVSRTTNEWHPVIPESPIRPDLQGEGETAHHRTR